MELLRVGALQNTGAASAVACRFSRLGSPTRANLSTAAKIIPHYFLSQVVCPQ